MSVEQLWPLFQVILVDLVLAGDNAIIIGLVAASVPPNLRSKVIFFGIMIAALMRIAFALVTVQLLQITGILLLGGLLLIWICWKLWTEIRRNSLAPRSTEDYQKKSKESLKSAITHIIIADISMSLDNVLAVAGIARNDSFILIVGLAVSIALMAFAATMIAKMLERHGWIAYIGLAVIFYVGITMIWQGALQIFEVI